MSLTGNFDVDSKIFNIFIVFITPKSTQESNYWSRWI